MLKTLSLFRSIRTTVALLTAYAVGVSLNVWADPPRMPQIAARELNLDEPLPIPVPTPVPLQEPAVPTPPAVQTPASPAPTPATPIPPSADPATSLSPGQATAPVDRGPAPGTMSPMDQGYSSPYGYQSGPTKEDITFPLGEVYTLRAAEQIGQTRQVVTNRDDFIKVFGASAREGILETPANSVRILGLKLGIVEVTLIGEKGVRTYRLRITPSVRQLETLIAKQFPLATVNVTAAGEHMLVVDGTVETPGDVEGILTLLQNFVGRQGNIINGIKVAGVSQVQLEVVIARVDRTKAKRMGINLEYAGTQGFGGSQIGGAGGVTPLVSASNSTAGVGNAFTSIGGAAASAITPASTVFVGVTKELQQFMAQLEFLKRNGVVKVLARPTLVTLTGRPAEFLVGGEQPFPYQVSAIAQPSVDFKKFGTRLNFLPVILGPDKIRLDLVPEFSTVDPDSSTSASVGGTSIPRFITQRIHTVVEMEPGQTLILGGLLQTEIAGQIDKVPFLGSLPYGGAAFRRVTYAERELELLVVVTPRFVEPLNGSEGPVTLPGEESRSPTDKELFFYGMPEARHDVEPKGILHHQSADGRARRDNVLTEPDDVAQVAPRSRWSLPRWRRSEKPAPATPPVVAQRPVRRVLKD